MINLSTIENKGKCFEIQSGWGAAKEKTSQKCEVFFYIFKISFLLK